ncbi:MAG: SDR family oxidoreductase, partial [Polyangiaceae bacterium]|nr:SDR family oxidoreductase [Polyangiaceae bacterium]
DIRDPKEVADFISWLKTEAIDVDILVNNAGILQVGSFSETSLEAWHEVFDVNLWGTVHLVQALLPLLKERPEAAIINMASASGLVGFTPLTAYSTSKFALVGLTQALAGELVDSSVHVGVICPGLVRTSIGEAAHLSAEHQEQVRELLLQRGCEPEAVAQAVISAIEQKRAQVNVGWEGHAMSLAARLLPAKAGRFIAKYAK